MPTNKRNKSIMQSEDAQSTVIGTVLVIGIFIAGLSIYFSTQVPEWTKDFESLHTANAEDDFSELKTLIDGIKGERFERTTNIKMCPDEVPIFGIPPPGSNLNFNPEDERFEIVVPVGGGGGGSGIWTIPNSGFTYYYDEEESNKVRVSPELVTLSGPTITDLIIDNTEMVLTGDTYFPYDHYYNRVIIKNNGVLSVSPGSGVLKIFASSITVDASSRIDADGCGYSAGTGTGYGGSAMDDAGGGGAGYGGDGGDGGGGKGGEGGTAYGDETSMFTQMGSGGGDGSGKIGGVGGSGGTGSGAIWLDAEEITIEGTISANGGNAENGSVGAAGGGGGGSGGGILIYGKDVTISGTLSANGGKGGNGYSGGDGGGGGGAGRIKVFYEVGTVSPVYLVERGERGDVGRGYGYDGDDGTDYEEQATYTASPTDIAYYSSGYFVSTVHDTGNDAVCYGEMTWDTTLNKQDIVMKVRTDWNESMACATPWDDCPELSSDSGENVIDLSGVGSVSPAAHRYVQFCAELSTDKDDRTPILQQFRANYSFPTGSPILANASGSIKFSSNYLYYPNQEIVYEHGAVIKYQREGGFMLQVPPIFISNEGGIPAIEISMVDLTGANYSYSGGTTTSMKSRFKTYNLLAYELRYPDFTINITTDYPSVWGNWFNKTLEKSGLDDSYFDVSVTGKNVEVNFYGKGDGVELYLEKTAVEVEI